VIIQVDIVEFVADPYPPYQFLEGETIRGVDHDVIAAAFAQHGLKTITKLAPWDECLRILDAGGAHGIFQIKRTAERENAYIFSDILRTAKTVFFRNRQKSIQFIDNRALAELGAKYVLGTVKGYSYDPFIDSLQTHSKVETESQEQLLLYLSEGKVDLALIDQGVASYLSHGLSIENVLKVEDFEITRELHVAFRKTLSKLADMFNSGLAEIRRKGVISRIFDEYGVSE
jgi:polar amino acid transport system substrate-binding protein